MRQKKSTTVVSDDLAYDTVNKVVNKTFFEQELNRIHGNTAKITMVVILVVEISRAGKHRRLYLLLIVCIALRNGIIGRIGHIMNFEYPLNALVQVVIRPSIPRCLSVDNVDKLQFSEEVGALLDGEQATVILYWIQEHLESSSLSRRHHL
jgi:hypothetical protein